MSEQAGPVELPTGTLVQDHDGHVGVVIRPEDSCWQRTRYRKTTTICADPLDGHVLVRLDQPVHTIRDYWYSPDQLRALAELSASEGGPDDD